MSPNNNPLATTTCIIGGGPAGIMLGFLLARQGIAATSQQGYFHYNCTAGIADGEPGTAVP